MKRELASRHDHSACRPVFVRIDLVVLWKAGLFDENTFADLMTVDKFNATFKAAKSITCIMTFTNENGHDRSFTVEFRVSN